MKKLFFFLAAMVLAITANAKVTTISPDAENDALRLAVHYAEDGDIIEMTEGTYVQCNNGYVAFDGKSVTVKAAEGANVVLQLQVPITLTNGGKATLQGIKIDASRLTELADWYEHVVYPTDATEGKELVMDGCELYGFNINKSAIYSSASNTLALCDVKNCYFHDNVKSCFFFEGASIAELSVVNSTFANIATDASGYYAGIIDVRNAAAKVTVDHCTFYNCLLMNTDYAAITMKGPQAANVVISNNIFMLPEAIDGHRAIRNDVEATNCMTFNYVKDNGGIHSSVTKTNCFLNVDPMFVDAANGNYALAEGSPALGAATDGSDLGDPRWNVVVEPEPTTETVYFINAKKWAKVNVYAWTTDPNASWPGAAATKEAEQIAGYDVYSFTANAGQYANVIFNDGSSQTPDLVWTAGKYYVIDMGWLTKEEAESKLAAPLPETWNIVGASGLMGTDWNLNDAKNAMTLQADGTYLLEKKGITIVAGSYEYKAAKDHGWTVSVPQDGNQTLKITTSGIYDVTFVLDVTAKKLTATATLKQAAVVIPTIVIAGDMNGWNQTKDKFTMSADSLTATFKATLTAKSYGFKMIVGGAWHSDGKTITRDANSTKFTGANSNTNSTLKADIEGEYIFTWEYATKTLTVTYPKLPAKPEVVTEMVGVVKRALQVGESVVVLTHEEDGTAHIYEIANGTILELVQEGIVPVNPDNLGDYLAISDIALTEDGKLVARNYMRVTNLNYTPDAGYERGENRFYIWNDLAGAPSVWFTSMMTSNSIRSDQGITMAVKGTSTNAKVLTTGVHNSGRGIRMSLFTIKDGKYVDPNGGAGNKSEYYWYLDSHFKSDAIYNEAAHGVLPELSASPLGENNWIMDNVGMAPSEFSEPADGGGDPIVNTVLADDVVGVKYNGATYVTVGEQVVMVAPYANAEGLLAGVKVLDITAGLDAAEELHVLNIETPVTATAAATAVAVEDNVLTITLVADAALHTLTAVLEKEPEIEWIPMDLEIANLVTEVMEVEGVKYLLLQGRDDMNDADVMLFLNNYADVDDDYEVNAENSYMTFGGMELTVLEGVMTQTSETDKGTIYTGIVRASVEEEGMTMYVEFALTMYAAPATVIELTDAIVAINEELGTLTFNVVTGEGEGYYAELAGYTAPGVHEGPQICLFETPEAVAFANYVETSVADGIITLKGEFTSFMGAKFDVTISGKLPVEEPVVKPEPTYTENNLNTYAFGLESELNDSALVVTYRLNNSNATSVNVLVYKGETVVATVAGTTTIGVNTVAIPVAELPQGRMLTWSVEVNGTSVEAPTQETKMYNMYCPHGLAIDTDPESEYFGRILVADAMDVVKDKAGYLGSGIGAGLHAFNPSFTTDSTVYTGGNDFTRILASNGYQPWRVKISEDGRIFVSSLDLNGVVVWEVSKDLQTWTPVIAGTNDATDHNIYDADGNFVAGLNCSMDVTGKGEDLKLLLYSTNNKGIAFNQSGYRLDEYALGTATTWTGTPKNILEGGKFGLVHTNVEFIYDGEGGYWFGASRAGNAGQPNLVHINAAGEQDYYTEDASLYGGDGVLVHNGMLFKGKARTSGTVGNFGVWTIGKDADGKVTLTEKWSVVADGIGRNLNEFAVDPAENLYVVGNSGEKIIAYALPYSGQVVTPAASKYAFHIGELLPDPAVVAEMVGVVKRAVQNGESTIVLTHETDGTPHIYEVTDGTILELLQNGVIARDPENAGDLLAISDIAVTEDGKLVAINYMHTQAGDSYVNEGQKRGETRVYLWNDLHDAPAILFKSKMSSNWFRSKQGLTMAVKGTSDNMEIFTTGIHATSAWARVSSYRVIDGVYVEPDVNHNDHYYFYDINDAIALETTVGTEYELSASPLGAMNWILDANLINPVEIVEPETNNIEIVTSVALNEDLGKKFNGATYVTVGEQVLMVAPYATPEGKLTGVEILDITGGLDAAQYVDQLFIDEAVEATAAATAVEVVEGEEATALLITLVADATIYSLEATLAKGDNWEVYEDEISNLVIDLDNLVLIGGPSSAFQVDVYLPLGEYNMSEDSYQLTAESSIAVMGQDATFIEGYAYEIDAFAPSAKAVVRCEWNGMKLEFHLTMTAAPLEATVVVVENAVVEIEKYLLWGDMYDYALKMTGEWVNPADGLTYPVLVEVPVYYPEATEPSEIMSTVTVGGWGDNDPWLGFGEGTLTVTTVDGLITATGIVQNPMAGVAIDITISGKVIEDAVENVQVTVKPVKMIQNGQLIIKKGDAEYNAAGAILK